MRNIIKRFLEVNISDISQRALCIGPVLTNQKIRVTDGFFPKTMLLMTEKFAILVVSAGLGGNQLPRGFCHCVIEAKGAVAGNL